MTLYFASGAIVTVRDYAEGTVVAGLAQLGFVLVLVAFVLVCFGVAVWDLRNAKVSHTG